MKAKVKKGFEGKGTKVFVKTRPGFGRTINLDTATQEQLELLLKLKHPMVAEDKNPPQK